MPTFERAVSLPASAEEVFDWHLRDGAFERLTPPWERVEVIERSGPLADGMRVRLRTFAGSLPQIWLVEHDRVERPRGFRDRQVSGPFARFEHEHRIDPSGPGESTLVDTIRYELPLGPLGAAAGKRMVEARLSRTFAYRQRVLEADLEAHAALRAKIGDRPMKVAVTGASGLLGSALVPFLATGGHEVRRLVRRRKAGPGEVSWDPDAGAIDAASLEGVDAVVHLAGENLGEHRWTEAHKSRVLASRDRGTRLLAEALAELEQRPKVLVSASATGFYGDRGDERITEASPPGEGFLADVCKVWEAAAAPAADAGIRVVNARIGVVLSPKGGALAKMRLPFKLGVGGKFGSGSQYFPWIAIDDVVYAVAHALGQGELEGPVNLTAPSPVTNGEFARALGRALGRPALFPLPAFAARLALGRQFADEAILGGARVLPERLLASGFRFRYPELEGALDHLLGGRAG